MKAVLIDKPGAASAAVERPLCVGERMITNQARFRAVLVSR
ncbi:MAG: hypothetical protein ABSH32_26405 [Bryobacteraceae bacterium]|jgi:hypothetical protein